MSLYFLFVNEDLKKRGPHTVPEKVFSIISVLFPLNRSYYLLYFPFLFSQLICVLRACTYFNVRVVVTVITKIKSLKALA